VKVAKCSGLHRGFLKYSEKNVVVQAMKYYGTPYKWGSSEDGVDCSGLVLNVYSVFGFRLPRNSSKQQAAAGSFKYMGNKHSARKLILALDSTRAGSILFLPGHVMLYLGKANKKHYIIQAALCYTVRNGYRNQMLQSASVTVDAIGDIIRSRTGKSSLRSIVSITTLE
jgi:cell wall-associated NlpC family hydrolase